MRQRRSTSPYPPDWDQISTAVKDAAQWRCVRCGHDHDVPAGYMLTVHHLDLSPAHCAWWNIPALCQRCHLIIQRKVIMERHWMFAHSPWFQPYAAAYYGVRAGWLPDTNHYQDSLVLVRPEFIRTWLGILLSLGRPQETGANNAHRNAMV